MTGSAAAWRLDRLSPDARDAAECAAREAGIPLSQWLTRLINDTCLGEGVAPAGAAAAPAASPETAPIRAVRPPTPAAVLRRAAPFRATVAVLERPAPPSPADSAPAAEAPPLAESEPFLLDQEAPEDEAAPPLAESLPEAAEPEALEPEALEPEALEPEALEPEAAAPFVAPEPASEADPELEPMAFTAEPDEAAPLDETEPLILADSEAAEAAPAEPEPAALAPEPAEDAVLAPAEPAAEPALEPEPEPEAASNVVPLGSAPGSIPLPTAALQPGTCGTRRPEEAPPAALVAAIAREGVRQPLVVRRLSGPEGQLEDQYEIIAGRRRWRIALDSGIAELPGIVTEFDDAGSVLASLMENLGRSDFSPLDEARAYLRLLTEFSLDPGAVVEAVGRERKHVIRCMRLLGLPPRARSLVESEGLSSDHAMLLLDAADPVGLAEAMVTENLSAAQARLRVAERPRKETSK